jgi:hypothetical protein
MRSITNRKGQILGSTVLAKEPAVWSSHPDEESPMMEAWRDRAGQKHRATALQTPTPSEVSLEDAVSFIEVAEPKTVATKIIRLVQPVFRVRPGKSADGESLTKEYFFRVRSGDADWLRNLLNDWPVALPKLMLGVGLGWWSLPWHRMELPPVSTLNKKQTLSIHICDSQWRQLCRNAAAANSHNPDPIRHCVMTTLGRVRVPKPGPVLQTVREQLVLQCVHRAVQLGHRANLLSQFHPDMGRLAKTSAELRGRIEKNGVGTGDAERVTRLNGLLKQLQDQADLCTSANEEWREFFRTAANIAVPKKQNRIGAK